MVYECTYDVNMICRVENEPPILRVFAYTALSAYGGILQSGRGSPILLALPRIFIAVDAPESDILVPDAIRASPIYPPYPRAPAIDVLTAQQQVADAMRHDVLRLRSSIASLSQAQMAPEFLRRDGFAEHLQRGVAQHTPSCFPPAHGH
ncbi:hypothetical protein B0H13DRAFT_2352999 [Mycena leptocephala]|nr:hypothetical protein B0H13DRAFT_2352999 [Mycena leptocephala]